MSARAISKKQYVRSRAPCARLVTPARFFHNGRVISGPASNSEPRQRLNQVSEYRARRPAADIPGRLCGGGSAKRLPLRAIEMALKFACSACGASSVQGTRISMRSRR